MDDQRLGNSPDQSAWDRANLVQRAAMLGGALPESKMDKEKFEQLLAVAECDAQIKLRVLYNAVVSGVRDYGASSTAANLNNWKSAEKELDKYIEKLWVKHFQGDRVFKNLRAVCAYLTEQGWKISQASVYGHHKAGKIHADSNGHFTLQAVERYISEANLRRIDGSKPADEEPSDKSRYETEILRIKSEQMAHKLDQTKGAYVPRYAFERSLAQRAMLFKSDIEAFIRGMASEMISVSGGSPEKVPDLIEFMLDEFQKILARYAEDREWIPPAAPAGTDDITDDGEEDEEGL